MEVSENYFKFILKLDYTSFYQWEVMLLIIPPLIEIWHIWELLVINRFCQNFKNFFKNWTVSSGWRKFKQPQWVYRYYSSLLTLLHGFQPFCCAESRTLYAYVSPFCALGWSSYPGVCCCPCMDAAAASSPVWMFFLYIPSCDVPWGNVHDKM